MVLGDPTDPERNYMNDLQDLALSGEVTEWKMPSGAKVGDVVLVYLTAPISAVVGYGLVFEAPTRANAVPDRPWGEGWWAEVGEFGMIEPPITNHELRIRVPSWKWPTQPRSATFPKGQAALDLLEFTEHRVPALLEDRLGDSLLSVERDHVYQVIELGPLAPGHFAVTRIEICFEGECSAGEVLEVLDSLEEARSAMQRHIANRLATAAQDAGEA